MPTRLDCVTITLRGDAIELPWDSREQLIEEMASLEGTEQVVRAFIAVGASAPVRLGRPEKELLIAMIDRWATDIDVDELPTGVWDLRCALVDDLAPAPGDIVVPKTRYSGFFNSTLDSTLRARGIRTLAFTGIATNVCVESTLRDAFHLEYFAVMLEDATHALGGPAIQQAAVYNIETFFGWVSTVADFCGAFGQIAGDD